MKKPLVSIITPSFNCAKTIGKTIESVLNQSYQNWEMLISDDKSTDNSCEVIKQLIAQDKRIKLIPRAWNAGPAVTRNRAIEFAKGRFVAFLDADDIWYPEKLEKQIAFMLDKNIAFSYTSYRRVHEDGRILGYRMAPPFVTYQANLKTNDIGCLTACYDTKKLGKVYMPNIARRQDWALWLKILKQLDKAYGMEECLADYNVGVSTVSSNKLSGAKYLWRVYREIEKLTLVKSVYYFLVFVFLGLKKNHTI